MKLLKSCIVLAIFSDSTSAFATKFRDKDTVATRFTHIDKNKSSGWKGRELPSGRKAETQLEMSSQGLVYGYVVWSQGGVWLLLSNPLFTTPLTGVLLHFFTSTSALP